MNTAFDLISLHFQEQFVPRDSMIELDYKKMPAVFMEINIRNEKSMTSMAGKWK